MEPFLGQLMLFAGNFAPRGWAFCNGQLLPIAQNQALFTILGTTYGGDGRVTFALPDLRGRVPVQWGQGPGLSNYVLGETTGRETTTLVTQQLPAHTHPVQLSLTFAAPASSAPADADAPDAGTVPAATGGTPIYGHGTPDITLAAGAVAGNAVIGNTGGNQPLDLRQPSLALSWVIATVGIFPSRS